MANWLPIIVCTKNFSISVSPPPICDSALEDTHIMLDKASKICRCFKVCVYNHCNTATLQHTATHCNTLQHTATHFKSHVWCPTEHGCWFSAPRSACAFTTTHCNTMQCTSIHTRMGDVSVPQGLCSYSLQHTATHHIILQHTALQYTAQHIYGA